MGNVGACVRVAAAAGAAAVLTTGENDPWFPDAVRGAAGLHFALPVAAVEGREAAGKHADYEGKVMCFFEIGDGKGTLLQFDYDHPPRPPKPNQLFHLGKIVFNKTYWHTVPKGRV